MFYWIIYILSAFVGLAVVPDFIFASYFEHHMGIDPAPGICLILGTIITTILFAVYIKRYKAYRYIPLVCLVGFFSFLPGFLLLGLLGLVALGMVSLEPK